MPIVGMPDGTQVQFPDDMPSQQIKSLIYSKFPDQAKAALQDNQPGLVSNIGSDISSRISNVQKLYDQVNSGQRSPAQNILPAIGQTVAGASDAVGDALNSGYKTLSGDDLGQDLSPLTNLVKLGVSSLPTFGGGKLGPELSQEAAAHPIIADNIKGAANIASVGVLGDQALSGLSTLKTLGEAAAPTIGDALAQTAADDVPAAVIPKTNPVTPQDSAARSVLRKKAYATADQQGGRLSADGVQSGVIDQLNSAFPKDEMVDDATGRDGADNIVDNIAQKWQGKPLSLQTIQRMDVKLNGLIGSALKANDGTLANKYGIIKHTILDAVDNAGPEQLEGGVAGFNAWNEGKFHFGIEQSLKGLESMVESGSNMQQPGNSIASRFNTLRGNANRMRFFKPEEQALISQIAIPPSSGMRALASGLVRHTGTVLGGLAGGGIASGITGGLVGHIGSEAFKDAIATMKLKQVSKLYDLINSRVAPAALEDVAPQTPLQIGYRGDAARIAEAQQSALQRAAQGRTGGIPVSQGSNYGDVPYNYSAPSPPPKTLALPSPETVSRLPMTAEQIVQAQAQNAVSAKPVTPIYSGGSIAASGATQATPLDQLADQIKSAVPASASGMPLTSYLKARGGLNPSGDLGTELAASDIKPGAKGTPVGLFNNSGVGAVDNIPADELSNVLGMHVPDGGNGYADPAHVHDILKSEIQNKALVQIDPAIERASGNLGGLNLATATKSDIISRLTDVSREAAKVERGIDLTPREAQELYLRHDVHGDDFHDSLDEIIERSAMQGNFGVGREFTDPDGMKIKRIK